MEVFSKVQLFVAPLKSSVKIGIPDIIPPVATNDVIALVQTEALVGEMVIAVGAVLAVTTATLDDTV